MGPPGALHIYKALEGPVVLAKWPHTPRGEKEKKGEGHRNTPVTCQAP